MRLELLHCDIESSDNLKSWTSSFSDDGRRSRVEHFSRCAAEAREGERVKAREKERERERKDQGRWKFYGRVSTRVKMSHRF